MGRTSAQIYPQIPRGGKTSGGTGPMDGFIQTPVGPAQASHGLKMAPSSPTSSVASDTGGPTLADISADLQRLSETMVTKQELSTTLYDSIATSVLVLRSDVMAQETRIHALKLPLLKQRPQIRHSPGRAPFP
ncbi:Hypothetical predicted protein [Pelobates cultripes]|uniref:Uncharacterized protein n=1 Tax=Pelobates cultripes TaxID=61616 RepID=A0AAD1S6D2_PELCU|nr:Hypothetical predicted protein [Pelobates cultripes]